MAGSGLVAGSGTLPLAVTPADCSAPSSPQGIEFRSARFDEIPRLEFNGESLQAICKTGTLRIDWLSGELHRRRIKATVRNEAVAKACGLSGKPAEPLNIVDLTAGLGRDAMVLASLGANVTLLERSPWLAALLHDAIGRASTELPWLNERLALLHQNSLDFLPQAVGVDCVYLDPMYPPRRKSALVKQDLRLIRELVGTDEDANELLATALASDVRRVVAKRPSYAKPIRLPSHTIESGATRFDVYLR